MTQLQLLVVLQLVVGTCLTSAYLSNTFPEEFMFGVATSAYQIEGAWNESGKGENIWDRFIHENESRIVGEDNADIACDSYHKFQEDIRLVYQMGLSTYRFSLSWSRIFPTGFNNSRNETAIKYYQDLTSKIAKYNLTPIVTLYHWDLPQPIQDLGGWTNISTVDLFVDYARAAFDSLRTVKYWITINEPKQVCRSGYGKGNMAPGINESGRSDYQCAYVILKAHAAAYRLYKSEFKDSKGLVSLALDSPWSEPATKNATDIEAAKRSMMFDFGLYANPIFIGGWPKEVEDRVHNRSKNGTRLPAFNKTEIEEINGTADFMAVNFYKTRLISDAQEAHIDEVSFENDLRVTESVDPGWNINFGEPIVPESLRSFLKWIKDTYNNPYILITENGMADNGSTLYDIDRIQFIADHLDSVLRAINRDKVRVHGYTFWSLLDNFEWTQGYSRRYGLYYVNFTDPDRERIPKLSVEYYREVASSRKIPDPSTYTTSPPPTTTPSTSTTENSSASSEAVSNILLCSLMVLFWRLAMF